MLLGAGRAGAMKRSLWRLCQSREKAATSSAYQGVVCEADAASVASQDVFKVRGDGGPLGRCRDRGGRAGTRGSGVFVRDSGKMGWRCWRERAVRWTGGALGQLWGAADGYVPDKRSSKRSF